MQDAARQQANLRLLQRACDPTLTQIVATATHVVLYEYLNGTTWSKCNKEGSMFLALKQQQPQQEGKALHYYYLLIILNRHSTENFIMPVTAAMQSQHQDPYLIFKQQQQHGKEDTTTHIKGIWFHDADERIQFHSVLQKCVTDMQQQELKVLHHQSAATITPQPLAPARPVESGLPGDGATADSSSSDTATLTSVLLSSLSLEKPPPPFSSGPNQILSAVDGDHGTTNETSTSSTTHAQNIQQPQAPPVVTLLDKKSLQLTLLSLIQDDRFLDLLHSQYLRVVRSRAKKESGL